jgi:hypothetical protein
MPDKLVDLIGTSDGSERPFDEWRMAAIQAGLQPNSIQNLKRRGLVYTYLTAEGVNMIVRGTRPTTQTT